jgi:hypothetical protein
MDERPLGAQTQFPGDKTRTRPKQRDNHPWNNMTEFPRGEQLVVDAIARNLPHYGGEVEWSAHSKEPSFST